MQDIKNALEQGRHCFITFLLIAWDKMVAMCESTCLTEKLLTKVVKIIFKEEFEEYLKQNKYQLRCSDGIYQKVKKKVFQLRNLEFMEDTMEEK